jgi:hypothetical protein
METISERISSKTESTELTDNDKCEFGLHGFR